MAFFLLIKETIVLLHRTGISNKQAKADNNLLTTNWDQQIRVLESITEHEKLLSSGFLYSLAGQKPSTASDSSLSTRCTTALLTYFQMKSLPFALHQKTRVYHSIQLKLG